MKKFKNFVIGGIQSKIFNLVAITMLLILTAYGVVLLYQMKSLNSVVAQTTEEQKKSMSEITSQTMDAVVNTSLSKEITMEAYIVDNLFDGVKNRVTMLADYATKLYNDPDNAGRSMVGEPKKANDGKVSTQLILADRTDISDASVEDEIGLLGNMEDLMNSMFESSNLSACFISTENGVTLITDTRAGEKFNDDGSVMTIEPTGRPWYRGAAQQKSIYFTDVEIDYFSGEIGIECSCPIYQNGKLVAVVGADLFLDSMAESINSSGENGSFTFIVSQNGQVIFSPMQDGVFKVEASDTAVDLRKGENHKLGDFISRALNGATEVQEVDVDGKIYYMCGAPIETVGWAVVNVVDKEVTQTPSKMMQSAYQDSVEKASGVVNENTQHSRTTILVLLGIILTLGTASSLILAKRIVAPLNSMSKQVSEIHGDNLDFTMEKTYRTNDEIEVLAEAFSDLSRRTKEYIAENTRITAEKERIGAELNVATQIQADMLPRIFPAFPERKEFDLFASMNPAKEVGGDFYDFFLVDDNHLAMVMADVSGKGVPAALFMVIAKTLIKNRALMGGTPGQILTDVNDQLCEGNEAELFVTVWMAIFDITTGKGYAANAGHEHPVLRHRGGKFEYVMYKHSPGLATMPGMKIREHEFQFEPGDVLFVYTDGVAEATNAEDELFGPDRLLDSLNANPDADPTEVLVNMKNSLADFVKDAPQFDDITMLCLNYFGSENMNE